MAKRRGRYNQEPAPKLTADQSKRELRFLLTFLRPFKVRFSLALLLMIISSAVSVAFPALIGQLVDVVLPGSASLFNIGGLTFTLGEFAVAMGALLLVQSVTRYFTSINLATISENVLAQLRSRLFERLTRLPMRFFAERRVGELSSRLTNDLTLIQDTLSFAVLEFIRQTVVLIGGVIFIAGMNFQLTGFVLLSVPPLVLIAVVFGRWIRRYSTQTQDAHARANTIVEESLQAIASVKSFGHERYEGARYRGAVDEGVRLGIIGAKLRSAFVSFIIFALFAGICAVIWKGGQLVESGEISLGALVSFLMYAMFIGGAMGSFADLVGRIQRTLGASVRIRELLDETPEDLPEEEPQNVPLLRSVKLDDVTFAYPNNKSRPALMNISMDVKPGDRIAVVGSSGAGKSTLANLLQRFYDPDSGNISFDGKDIAGLDLATVRHNVGIVPQDIVLFGGTIEENIRYGRLDASHEDVNRAAQLANADEFIASLEKGMQTIVGERGQKLSGGQRQRIAIARAILKNPPILILDEATSSLDAHSEHLIQEAMKRLMEDRTTIVIAHRLSTIRLCNRIYVFDKGRIVEEGSHEELLAREGVYAYLCELQFGMGDGIEG